MSSDQGTPDAGSGTQQTELGALLAGAVRAVVDAQDRLDEHARERAAAYAVAEPGTFAVPPLWYAFDAVGIDIELSTEVVRTGSADGGPARTELMCRTVNPVTAGVYGYAAASGTKVSVTLAPQRVLPTPTPTAPAEEGTTS